MSSYSKRLYRSNSRILGGVCSGIAEYFAIDPVLVRIAWVAFSLAWGAGILLYLLAWIIIPPSPYVASPTAAAGAPVPPPPAQGAPISSNTGLIAIALIGAIILMAGLANLVKSLFRLPFDAYVLPVALMVIGAAVILIAVARRR